MERNDPRIQELVAELGSVFPTWEGCYLFLKSLVARGEHNAEKNEQEKDKDKEVKKD